MKNMTYHEDFQSTHCPSNSTTPQRAATIGAGVQVMEMYKEMDKYGVAIGGGMNPVSRNIDKMA
jgi:hypothetical protein